MFNINLNSSPRKPKVIVEGGIHGHEWAPVVFVTYLINELAQADTSEDYEWKKFAHSFDWYLIPVLNPDGYDYTHKQASIPSSLFPLTVKRQPLHTLYHPSDRVRASANWRGCTQWVSGSAKNNISVANWRGRV
ncbi:zinc carboxypeptidase A 1-like [Cydia pomonella]|uniref:zinc carboxypeptidase A 1-like n=1 Tax=Cydia pomonella TaxID=82600 RepID=UPI002ADD85A3|nr:zinc carboxypeptidase A 1-like [Cydia pomonella]